MTQKYSLQQKLQRMKDSKNFQTMKSKAMGSKSSQGNSEVSSGYGIHHLMMVAIIGMLVGAYLQLKFLTSPAVAPASGATPSASQAAGSSGSG